MMLHSSLFTSIIISGIFYLTVFSVGHASPILNSDLRGARSTLSPRAGTEAKEPVLIRRNQSAPGSEKDSATGTKKLSKTKQQRNEAPLSDVIPKDPNGFFHPASLNRFKSSIASFKAWQHLNFLPDAATLARTKAQDVASEIDYFIDKISTEHRPDKREEKPSMSHLKS
ncbi:hypothetical protein PGT21_004639 [Puccinia graminis f. sp. tritici]|uniref:Uncharacterized protein n=1 Tax=Puccinia graminis f. sp. tritici TaxID=56615 RepID=A0A5B0QEA7_PUCGR|nr:hypothetical protein PGT21_004639 [Puccinia graminis f. sp. tritici]